MDRPRMDCWRYVWGSRQSNTEGTACESCAEKGKTDVFLFLGERSEGCLLYPPGGSRSRSAAIAALGYRHRREKRRAQLRLGVENPACGGLRPPDPAYPAYIP